MAYYPATTHRPHLGRRSAPAWATRVSLALALIAAGLTGPLPARAAEDGEAKIFELRIEKRAVAGPDSVIQVIQGDTVELRWRTDEAVELHLQGYGLTAKVKPGAPTVMRLPARATGRFPLTTHSFHREKGKAGHGHHKALIHLEVHPR